MDLNNQEYLMKKIFLLLLPVLFVMNISAQTTMDSKVIQLNEKDLTWRAGIPGTLISVLEGDPVSDSLYTIRLKVPANFVVKPHWHTSDERVTVLSGSVYVGFGDKVDKNNSVKFTPGGYYVNPPTLHHFIWTDEPAEIQITGIGPWIVNYIN
jgi:uncharacterized RmlC-like cupin family protein